jgi:hypothetical protein
MKEFSSFVSESLEQDENIVEFLKELDDQAETALEAELIGLIISLIKMKKIDESAYDSIYDMFDSIVDFETIELDYDYDEDFEEDESDEEPVDEAQRALYKRAGYVRCPDGKIRKRGKCGKPLDRQKSRKMVKARKKFKKSFAKGQRKSLKTKRRLGMIK